MLRPRAEGEERVIVRAEGRRGGGKVRLTVSPPTFGMAEEGGK